MINGFSSISFGNDTLKYIKQINKENNKKNLVNEWWISFSINETYFNIKKY